MMDFYLDSSQDFYAAGRVEYALEMSTRGIAAMRHGAYPVAFKLLETSARAFPLPAVLTSAGVCLLLTLRPADAVFYFAASVGMSQSKARLRPMLLLAKALLLAQEKVAGISILKEVMELHSIWLTGLLGILYWSGEGLWFVIQGVPRAEMALRGQVCGGWNRLWRGL